MQRKQPTGEATFDGYNKVIEQGKAGLGNSITIVNTDWTYSKPTWHKLNNTKSGMTDDTYGTILGGSYHWLASRCMRVAQYSAASFYVRCVSSNYVDHVLLYTSTGGGSSNNRGVCPLISINTDLFTGGGNGTSSNPWQLSK